MRGRGMVNARTTLTMVALVMSAMLPAPRAFALNPETLLMPGKLSSPHAKYEEDCTNCHNRSDRSKQRQLCLDCHKPIAADISRKQGFHGKAPGMAAAQCSACHSEHLGREADIVRFSRASFDHQLTDFHLEGAHASVPCESCHEAATARPATT
jgi:hypothetical protein